MRDVVITGAIPALGNVREAVPCHCRHPIHSDRRYACDGPRRLPGMRSPLF
jgi:hypothetical protein